MQTFLFIDLFNKNGLRNFSAEKKKQKTDNSQWLC